MGEARERRQYTVAVLSLDEFRVSAGPLVIDYEDQGLDSPDGPSAVALESGGFVVVEPGAGQVRFYSDDLELRSAADYSGAGAFDLSVLPGDESIAFVASDGIWLVRTGDESATLLESDGSATNIEVSPDGRRAVVVRASGLVNLLDLETGFDLGTLGNGSGALVGNPQWSSDGTQVSLPTLGAVVVLDLDPAVWAKRACDLIGTPVSDKEWKANAPAGINKPDPC